MSIRDVLASSRPSQQTNSHGLNNPQKRRIRQLALDGTPPADIAATMNVSESLVVAVLNPSDGR